MRKIEREFENPIDNILIDICELVAPYFHQLDFTPNGITTLSMITGVFSCYFLADNKPIISVLFLFLSYFFDSLDGFYARKYDMVTKFGDYYDHVKDVSVTALLLAILYKRNKHKLTTKETIVLLSVALVFYSLMCIQFSLQEILYAKPEESETLGFIKKYVDNKEDAAKLAKITRYFGCGTVILFNMMLILYLENK